LPGKPRLDILVKKISLSLDSARWIRLLYLHPRHIDDALLREIAQNPKVCKYIDLPVQHINDRILKAMNRRITKGEILALIAKIRKIIPGVVLRTSLIVGFPGETDKEFQELVDFVKSIKFNRLGVFTYSREEGTPAFHLKGQVKNRIKNFRKDKIMKLQRNISLGLNSALIGKYLNVLIEEKSRDGFIARSEFDAPEVDGIVYVKTKKNLKIGQIVETKIIGCFEYDLVAQV
jgi:ribosomal protein S12 methylthiotransferase